MGEDILIVELLDDNFRYRFIKNILYEGDCKQILFYVLLE